MVELSELSVKCRVIGERAALRAGRYIKQFSSGVLPSVTHKEGHHDVVTQYDVAAEKIIVELILREHPDSAIVGEEGGQSGNGEVSWFIDPIDGTSNFATHLPAYCVSIGAVAQGKMIAGVIYDPDADELFSADLSSAKLNGEDMRTSVQSSESDSVLLTGFPYEGNNATDGDLAMYKRMLSRFRGVRRLGSSALGLAYVAAGRAGAATELNAHPWDIAAGLFIVQQAGGSFYVEREPVRYSETAPISDPWLCPRWVAVGAGFDFDSSILKEHLQRPRSEI